MGPVTAWSLPTEYPRLSGTVGFDIETRDPLISTHGPGWAFHDKGEICGFAFTWGKKGQRQSQYFPMTHREGPNLDRKMTLRWLRDTFKQTSLTTIVHGSMYEKGWLRREGIPIKGKVFDTQSAAPILDEYRFGYGLDALSKDYLGRGKDEDVLRNYAYSLKKVNEKTGRLIKAYKTVEQIKSNLWRFPASIVGPYGEVDSANTLDLWDLFEPMLHEQDAMKLFDVETRLIDVLIEMRWRGIRVQTDEVEQAIVRLRKEQAVIQKQLDSAAGFHMDVNNNDDLVRAFRSDGITMPKTKTGRDSFKKGWLDTVDTPLGKLVNGVRRIDKAVGTFLEGCVLFKTIDGRVHGQFHPQKSDDGGAVTGRFSGSTPNLQFLPARDKEIKRLVRGAFLPEEGEEWAASDYSQQEPRLTVHFAVLGHIQGARKAQKAYIDDPDMDYHRFMADLTGLERDYAKIINLGVGYGMGGAKLCHSLKLPTKFIEVPERDRAGNYTLDPDTGERVMKMIEVAGDEGQAILDQYHENAPFVKGLSQDCMKRAKKRGYVMTLLGRRCRLTNGAKGWGRQDWYYKAMNKLIQGSAADQTKLAMLACWDAGYVPKVTVHDELGFSVPDRKTARHIAELMENCVTLQVPSKVDVELGPSWGLAAEQLKSEQEEDPNLWEEAA